MDQIIYALLIISTLVALFFSLSILGKDDKQQIHFAVLGLTISVIIWNVAVLLNLISTNTRLQVLFEQLYFLGPITVSVSVLFLGLIYAHSRIEFNKAYLSLFIVPIISLGMLFTNQYHHLFYATFSLIPSEQDFGIYFTLHSIVSYIYIGVGIIHLGIFTFRNSGFYSRQSLLVFLAILVAVIFDSFSTMKIFDWPTYWENVVFTFSVACLILAVIKYDFLSLIPIALKTVVDSLTDSYVVINNNYEIIDYNRRFAETFSRVLAFKRKESIIELIRKSDIDFNENLIIERVEESVEQKSNISFEVPRVVDGENYYYKVEIIPIFKKDYHIGTIVLIRDITENKKYLDQITMLNIKLKDLAIRDGLTQTYNRYFFDERLQQEIDKVYRRQIYRKGAVDYLNSFGLIIFDLDFFKNYNDKNGHLAGDELLQTLVKVVKSVLFSTDVLCRYGGEEFAIICCETTFEGTDVAAEKIRRAVESYKFKYQESQPNEKITISVGATYYSSIDMEKDDLIKKADRNLYKAKSNGRNTVVLC